jgi:hypothetical protein
VFERLDSLQKVWQDSQSVRSIAREAFRSNKHLQARLCCSLLSQQRAAGAQDRAPQAWSMLTQLRRAQDPEDVGEALDQGLEAVQLLHTEYEEALARLRSTREVRADRASVEYSLGQVMLHRKFGYRGAT